MRGYNEYIGARYVPVFDGDWDNTKEYEPLVIVSYQGNSYTSKTFVPKNASITDTKYWALTGNYNAQVEAYRQEVLDYTEEVNRLSNQFNIDKLIKPHILHGNILIDYFHDTTSNIQGACYIGNNKIVAYFAKGSSNTGDLVCFNMSTQSIEWSYAIEGYHGNSVVYRPLDNCVYIAGMADYSDLDTLINKIIVVDLYAPSTIKEVIEAPVSGIYSIAYDAVTDKFYSVNSVGSVSGTANELYEYNGIFESVHRTVLLDEYPAVIYKASTQGACFANDGIIYTLAYGYSDHIIIGNSAEDGSVVLIAKQPSIVNNYRMAGESQALIYDFDNDEYYIASLGNSGYQNKNLAFIYNIDLFKGINLPEYNTKGNYGYSNTEDEILISVKETDINSLKPYDGNTITTLKSVQDGLTLARHMGKYCSVICTTTLVCSDLKLNGFLGSLQGYDSSHKLNIDKLPRLCGVNCRFLDVVFTGQTNNANVHATRNSNIILMSCTFEDATNLSVHIKIEQHSTCYVRESDCVFNSSKRKYLSANGSEIMTDKASKFAIEQGPEFTSVTDTYVYTGTEVLNNDYETTLIMLACSSSHSKCTGIILSDSASAIDGTHIKFQYESGSSSGFSPLFLLFGAGRYYAWAKYDDGGGTEKTQFRVRKIDIGE